MRKLAAALGACALLSCASDGAHVEHVTAVAAGGPRLLAVIAHPDDESTFAATLYKAAVLLGATCDVLVITNGEAGFKYSTLAEPLYGLELTREDVGRRHLPRIRRAEMLAGARILGLRDVWFLDQTDQRYTQDADEILGDGAQVWDLDFVARTLDAVLAAGDYDFVFTLLPRATTHGHHQAATILALRAVRRLEPGARPVVLGAATAASPAAPPPHALSGLPLTALDTAPALVFDRTEALGHAGRLDYRIVVRWLIAAHKSQGTMQLAPGGEPYERFFLYALNDPGAFARARALFDALWEARFEVREYGQPAGTKAVRG